MSHHSIIEYLIDELIRLTTSLTLQSNSTRLSALKSSALYVVRQHSFLRTNPFDVENQLDGLDEKFRISSRDDLADALSERRTTLRRVSTRWAPEILHFLLEISYRPLSNSKLSNLECLKDSPSRLALPLKWSDILSEDLLQKEKDIWDNVNFGDESTDDEYELTDKILDKEEEDTFLLSPHENNSQNYAAPVFVEYTDNKGLKILRESQFWQKVPNVYGIKMETVKKSITELQAIRELLFMLGGYPTSLFKIKSQSPIIIEASKDYALNLVSQDCFLNFLRTLASKGTVVMTLRLWVKYSQGNPLLQVFQRVIVKQLEKFDALLSKIHLRFLAPEHNTIVSLLNTEQEITPLVQFLAHLVEIIRRIEKGPCRHVFLYLEILFELTCTSQMAGNDTVYTQFGKIFFDCFQVYLRPIRAWIEEGELRENNTDFFVCETIANVELSMLWEYRFRIRKTKDGVLHVPSFLRPVANRIFNTGKSIVILKYLNQTTLLQNVKKIIEPLLDFQTVCKSTAFQQAPFLELFDTAFEAWVTSRHQYAASLLKETLFNSCGLHTSLDALSHIYFLADGSVGSFFTGVIFKNLDSLKSSWNDRFTLTEHAQNSFSSISSVSHDRLRMSISPLAQKHRNVEKSRKSVKALSAIELKYQLSWPIQIIITSMALISYQRIFIFLLQVRRSSEILSRETFKRRTNYIHDCNEQALYYSLRMRLLWFSQIIYYYLTSLVLEPCTQQMKADLKAAEDVDMMIKVHSDYVNRCIDQALLGKNLDVIYNAILKVLNLGIRLHDARANNNAVSKFTLGEQNSLIDLSIAGLGLYTDHHQKYGRRSPDYYRKSIRSKRWDDSSSDDYNAEIGVHSSILSSLQLGSNSNLEIIPYVSQLHHMKAKFNRLVKFIVHGLKGVARAAGGEEARVWDTLSDMLGSGSMN